MNNCSTKTRQYVRARNHVCHITYRTVKEGIPEELPRICPIKKTRDGCKEANHVRQSTSRYINE
ncbi:MAG: hypothetical protein OZ917_09150 [Candidatus Brocadiaceae bacterium]|nr:hypothetical protein [Candidatus Brocadiaceae bacterium]